MHPSTPAVPLGHPDHGDLEYRAWTAWTRAEDRAVGAAPGSELAVREADAYTSFRDARSAAIFLNWPSDELDRVAADPDDDLSAYGLESVIAYLG